MTVKKEPSGRRSTETTLELPGTPEEVWRAIATGPGISSWLVPTEMEERDGKPVSVKMSFGPGMEPTAEITHWDAPRKYATKADGWIPGSPPIATEWIVEARGGNMCTVRIVQSLFASTDDWDMLLDGAKSGLSGFLAILRVYLTHFRGERSALRWWRAPAAGTEADAWGVLTGAFGLRRESVGQRWAAPAGLPPLAGVVEYFNEGPNDALVRIDTPAPGVAAFGTIDGGGQAMVGMNLYLYGDQAGGAIAREAPRWDAWFRERFPAPAGQGTGG